MSDTPSHTLAELATLVSGEIIGSADTPITGFNSLELAGPGELTFVVDTRRAKGLDGCRAAAVIVPEPLDGLSIPQLVTPDPDLAAAIIHSRLVHRDFVATGIHPSAVIGEGCVIPDQVAIGPLVAIGDRVRLGQRVTIHAGVVIEDGVEIGDDCVLHANAVVARHCRLNNRVVLYHGAVIGSDGFGFATDRATGAHVSKPQVGTVHLEDDVHIGANTCVDRAAFGVTRIRAGARLDNLVMIGHNVEVGAGSILVAQTGVAGSTRLGRGVVLGAKAGVAGHLNLEDGTMVAAMGGVHNDQPPGSRIGGIPAIDVRKWGRASAVFARLPEMARELRRLKKQVEELAKRING